MIYLTGDTHGRFERIGAFCDKMQTDRDDILIILGDAGINFHADARDILRKEYLVRLPITLFCIHGNHERRPESLGVYAEREWHGGQVFTEDGIPISCSPRMAKSMTWMDKRPLLSAVHTASTRHGAWKAGAGGRMSNHPRKSNPVSNNPWKIAAGASILFCRIQHPSSMNQPKCSYAAWISPR